MASSDDVEQMIRNALESLELINYSAFRRRPEVSEYLATMDNDNRISNTLELYSYYRGNLYRYYRQNEDKLIPANDAMVLKLIQLSVISIIRGLKMKSVGYDVLMREFEIGNDLELEKLLIRVSCGSALKLRFESSDRVVNFIELGTRNVVSDLTQLNLLTADDVILKKDLIAYLEEFQRVRLTSALEKLNYHEDKIYDDDAVKRLVKANLKEINKITGYTNKELIKNEIKSRKRKVGE